MNEETRSCLMEAFGVAIQHGDWDTAGKLRAIILGATTDVPENPFDRPPGSTDAP